MAAMNEYKKGTGPLAVVASPVAKLASQESSSSVSPPPVPEDVEDAVVVELVEESLDDFWLRGRGAIQNFRFFYDKI